LGSVARGRKQREIVGETGWGGLRRKKKAMKARKGWQRAEKREKSQKKKGGLRKSAGTIKGGCIANPKKRTRTH